MARVPNITKVFLPIIVNNGDKIGFTSLKIPPGTEARAKLE
jgi:hypothetical protein